jgi:hypothetical protein
MEKTTKVLSAVAAVAMVVVLASAPAATAQDYSGHRAVLGIAEYITAPGSGEPGGLEVLAKDVGNGQLAHDFVYGDPRRASFNGGNAGVTYGVNAGWNSTDPNLADQLGWLYDSIFVWDNEICADMTLSENAITPGLPGVVQLFFQTGQIFPIWQADMTQVGFLSGADFPYFAANPNVLGVTFTLFWTDAQGNLTDIDGNGKIDVAFREIYYNDEYDWADNGLEGPQPGGGYLIDFPTVAIHEVGHGFSAAHFGLIGVQKGFLVARPRAVMNAIYGGTLRELLGRDVGSHCSNWAQWPNN